MRTNEDFKTKKSLGQNFIDDPQIISEIVDASGVGPDDKVVEIGPGLGMLTEELSKRAGSLIAVELDDRLIPILRAKFLTSPNVTIVHQDILEFDWNTVNSEDNAESMIPDAPGNDPRSPAGHPCSEAADAPSSRTLSAPRIAPGAPATDKLQSLADMSVGSSDRSVKETIAGLGTRGLASGSADRADVPLGAPALARACRRTDTVTASQRCSSLRVVGNLPYYITTPILMGLLEKKVPAKNFTVMVQKEVAEKIIAVPGNREYGVLAISLQYYCDCRCAMDVPKEYFSPQPKVDSAVVVLEKKSETGLNENEEKIFFELVKKAFSQRRKTLPNSLEGFRGLNKDQLTQILNTLNISAQKRPENLSVEEYIALSKEIKNAGH